jgi:hypothetical protein
MGLVDLNELLEEGLDGLRRRTTTALNTADTPGLDWTLLVVHGELASIEPPPAGDHVRRLDGSLLGTNAEMNVRRGENTSLNFGGFRANLQAVVTKIGVIPKDWCTKSVNVSYAVFARAILTAN